MYVCVYVCMCVCMCVCVCVGVCVCVRMWLVCSSLSWHSMHFMTIYSCSYTIRQIPTFFSGWRPHHNCRTEFLSKLCCLVMTRQFVCVLATANSLVENSTAGGGEFHHQDKYTSWVIYETQVCFVFRNAVTQVTSRQFAPGQPEFRHVWYCTNFDGIIYCVRLHYGVGYFEQFLCKNARDETVGSDSEWFKLRFQMRTVRRKSLWCRHAFTDENRTSVILVIVHVGVCAAAAAAVCTALHVRRIHTGSDRLPCHDIR